MAKYNSASKYAAPFIGRFETPRLPRETLVVVCFISRGEKWKLGLHLIFVSIFDLPSIFSIVGSIWARKLWQLGLVAVFVAIIGEVLSALVSVHYTGPELFPYRLIAQLIVVLIVFFVTMIVRNRRDGAMLDNDSSDVVEENKKALEAKPSEKFIDLFFKDATRLLSPNLPWSERTTLEKSYTAVVIIMLAGLLPLPYVFYDFLRIVVCIGLYFYFIEILPHRKDARKWFVLIIVLLVLYNPVVPMHIGEKVIWAFLNAGTVYALFRLRLRIKAGFGNATIKELDEMSNDT